MDKQRASQVFVPGGMPKLTYVERSEGEVHGKLESAKDNLCKLVTLTGQTKSGKTVITRMVFPVMDDDVVWIDGGSITTEDDIWEQVLEKLNGYHSIEVNSGENSAIAVSGKVSGTASAFVVKGTGEAGLVQTDGKSNGNKKSRTISAKSSALKVLSQTKSSLIIDDFHYLDRDLQGNFIRAIKPLVFDGVPVVLIAIPHRRYDAVKVEKEITGRLENISMPSWEMDELKQIAKVGFPLLNMEVSDSVIDKIAKESLGSPHLMQEFCKAICLANNVKETLPSKLVINSLDDDIFRKVAESTGKIVFDKLASGPNQRTDRIPRKLKSGEEVDIYKVVLYALSHMKPGMQSIQYEELRSAIRELVQDAPPQAHEVTRVIEKMAKIAATEEASTPVIDWDKEDRKLHITDPFFAFYLKWR